MKNCLETIWSGKGKFPYSSNLSNCTNLLCLGRDGTIVWQLSSTPISHFPQLKLSLIIIIGAFLFSKRIFHCYFLFSCPCLRAKAFHENPKGTLHPRNRVFIVLFPPLVRKFLSSTPETRTAFAKSDENFYNIQSSNTCKAMK